MNNILVNIRKTLLPREKSTNKAVLVTGCDSGFGAKIADHLTDLGFHVFAGCLSREKAVASHPPCFNRDFLQMNVTSESEIKEAMDVIRKRLQETGTELWAVINNAGLGTFGEVEWVPISAYQRLMDVNVWGTIRVTQASLPLIRKTRGRVINVSSMLGRMGYPIRSPYCISKFSVEALSDCLRYEMKRWGVKVVVVEPGNYIAGTSIFSEQSVRDSAEAMWRSMSPEARQEYGKEYFDGQVTKMLKYINTGDTDLSPVVNAFEDAVLSKHPMRRYIPASWYYWARVQAATHLPAPFYEFVYRDIS